MPHKGCFLSELSESVVVKLASCGRPREGGVIGLGRVGESALGE